MAKLISRDNKRIRICSGIDERTSWQNASHLGVDALSIADVGGIGEFLVRSVDHYATNPNDFATLKKRRPKRKCRLIRVYRGKYSSWQKNRERNN